jgi:hypothetical protein
MIHLSDIFVVRKGQYSPTYVLVLFFCCQQQKCLKNCNNFQKLSIIMMLSSVIGAHQKQTFLMSLAVRKSQHLQGYFVVPISRKSHINHNICPSIAMWQGTKLSHCNYIKNDSSPMSLCCLEEYIWPNMWSRGVFLLKMAKILLETSMTI